MANMTDTGRTASILNYYFNGGTLLTPNQPYMLKLMTAMGSGNGNVTGSNGTEATSGNCPGYTAGGKTLGASAPFGSFSTSSPVGTSANGVTWSATGTWTTIVGIEIWDSAGTPLRWFQGLLTASITGVVNGDTVSFAAGAITVNGAGW
jgi:hypothetical protein